MCAVLIVIHFQQKMLILGLTFLLGCLLLLVVLLACCYFVNELCGTGT